MLTRILYTHGMNMKVHNTTIINTNHEHGSTEHDRPHWSQLSLLTLYSFYVVWMWHSLTMTRWRKAVTTSPVHAIMTGPSYDTHTQHTHHCWLFPSNELLLRILYWESREVKEKAIRTMDSTLTRSNVNRQSECWNVKTNRKPWRRWVCLFEDIYSN